MKPEDMEDQDVKVELGMCEENELLWLQGLYYLEEEVPPDSSNLSAIEWVLETPNT